jgi:hypothetical protein
VKPDITPNYIIVWVAICILAGAFAGGKNNRGIKNMHGSAPYGYSIPYIQNAMPERYFIFLRRFTMQPSIIMTVTVPIGQLV